MLSQPLPIPNRRGCGVLGGDMSGVRRAVFIFFLYAGSIAHFIGMGIMQFLFIRNC